SVKRASVAWANEKASSKVVGFDLKCAHYTKYQDADETIEEAINGTLNLEEHQQDSVMSDIAGDKTSADYYFDSYSHFGNLFFSAH
ncbi:hypothetical protein Tco_0061253, partial [Tanacetum coccineum]